MTLRAGALVTGAARRLGAAMAEELARAGFDVAVHYHGSESEAAGVAARIEALGRKAVLLRADLLDDAQAQALLPEAATALGKPVTCLVNNASIFEYDTLESATPESWERHMGSNLRAPFLLTQAMAAQVPDPVPDARGEKQAQGLVINMLDQRIRKLTPEFMTYTLAKMGLWALTRTAAQALGARVRVNGIGPGPTLIGARQSEAHFDRQRGATVLERGSNPEEIAGALRYLLDAHGVTGQMIAVDGGQHLAWQTPDILGVEPG